MRVWIEQKGTEGEAIVLIAALRFRVLVCAKLTKRSRAKGSWIVVQFVILRLKIRLLTFGGGVQ